jgi:predicted ATPase
MSIKKLHIENFRGIEESIDVDIKPITIFVGPNSSGKSSCIHALACLSQTIKIIADKRPLVLDDEFADVHLGRFIEVIHSKSYQDQIGLGISLDNVELQDVEIEVKEDGSKKVKRESIKGNLKCFYKFKCSKRTQEISLETFETDFNGPLYSGKRIKEKYSITTKNQKIQIPVDEALGNAFLIEDSSLFLYSTNEDLMPFDYISTQSAQAEIQNALTKTLYLGPFRQPPARRYASRGAAPSEVGPMGESTITMLANESIQSTSRPHLTQIAKWLSHMKLAKAIDVNRIGSSDLFNVNLTLNDGEKFPLADLGYGLSQVLPVLAQCSFAPKNSTLLFEQPELHVHPLASKGLAKVFVDTVKQKNSSICLETHSPDLIRAFFQEVAKGNLNKDDLQIYNVRRIGQKTNLKKIEVDEYGDNYENWEKDLSF